MSKKELTPQEELFCSNYTALGTPCFNRKERSAIEAGYSEKSARNAATGLLRRPDIQARIAELHAENMQRNLITTDKVLSDLENTRLLAVEKGDFSTAARCSELQGKTLAMFSDFRVDVFSENQLSIDEAMRKEALAFAKYRLTGQLPESGFFDDLSSPRQENVESGDIDE